MVAKLINGKEVAKKKRLQLMEEVRTLETKGIVPGLAVILVGDDPASKTYVQNKQKACHDIGIRSFLYEYSADTSETELLSKIGELNQDENVHGILVQLPLPNHIDTKDIIHSISPDKDVDGFHPINVGKMVTGEDAFISCTPYGIMELLDEISFSPSGKHAVVVGRSNIVGKPMGQLLLNANATVTYCHSKTEDLSKYTRQADLLILAVGKAQFIKAEDIKEGAVVIDVGMNRDKNGKLCGDVLTANVMEKASYVTPVPGGVGPMTITMLLFNTVKAAKKLQKNRLI